jgi:hypothetical protein
MDTTAWHEDPFMSSWDAKYVSTNLKDDAAPYDKALFLSINDRLAQQPELKDYAYTLVVRAEGKNAFMIVLIPPPGSCLLRRWPRGHCGQVLR